MHANDQHFLVVGAIEDADLAALGEPARRAPEEVMLQFVGAWLFEAADLAALGIDSGHDMPDGPILPGSVHALEDHQQRMAVRGVMQALQRTQLSNVLLEQFLVLLLRPEEWLHEAIGHSFIDFLSRRDSKVLWIDSHLLPSVTSRGVEFLISDQSVTGRRTVPLLMC